MEEPKKQDRRLWVDPDTGRRGKRGRGATKLDRVVDEAANRRRVVPIDRIYGTMARTRSSPSVPAGIWHFDEFASSGSIHVCLPLLLVHRIQDASDTCKGCRILLKRHVRYFGEEDVLREKYVIGHTRPLFFQRYFPSSRFENHYFFLDFF